MKGYAITDIGKVRSENQDSVRYTENVSPAFGILAVCDGMGGANAGSIASATALDIFVGRVSAHLANRRDKTKLDNAVLEAVDEANAVVYEHSLADLACEGMGTTLVAALVTAKSCRVVNVGDSRAYLISSDTITQVTRDHSFVEDLVERGIISRADARTHPRKNIITRAVGVEPTVECDVFAPKLKKNDLLLLCSDGLTNAVADEELLETVSQCKDLEKAAQALLDLALQRGAPDNVTVGLLRK